MAAGSGALSSVSRPGSNVRTSLTPAAGMESYTRLAVKRDEAVAEGERIALAQEVADRAEAERKKASAARIAGRKRDKELEQLKRNYAGRTVVDPYKQLQSAWFGLGGMGG